MRKARLITKTVIMVIACGIALAACHAQAAQDQAQPHVTCRAVGAGWLDPVINGAFAKDRALIRQGLSPQVPAADISTSGVHIADAKVCLSPDGTGGYVQANGQLYYGEPNPPVIFDAFHATSNMSFVFPWQDWKFTYGNGVYYSEKDALNIPLQGKPS